MQFEGGFDTDVIVTHLITSFQSPAAPGLSWSQTLDPGGTGFHGSILWSPETDDTYFGLSGGYFASAAQSRRSDAGGFYSRETMDVRGGWGALVLKHYVKDWAFAKVSLGSFIYNVQTHIETNAPNFTYDGVSGTRGIAAVGLGLGFETPWDFPLHVGVEGAWWFSHNQDPPVEAGVGQLGANLLFRF
jgi:hypothetical protein